MICVSLNEVEYSLRKAASARGWPFGLAEDLGRAGTWSAACRPDALPDLLDMLEAGFQHAKYAIHGSLVEFERASAASVISGLDLLAAGCQERAMFHQVAWPLGLLALCGSASGAFGTGFRICAEGTTTEVGAGDWWSEGSVEDVSGPTIVECRAAAELAGSTTPKDGVLLDNEAWKRLQKLAAAALVPATEESRVSGAGAGLVDSD